MLYECCQWRENGEAIENSENKLRMSQSKIKLISQSVNLLHLKRHDQFVAFYFRGFLFLLQSHVNQYKL